jgi:hypothetical protein
MWQQVSYSQAKSSGDRKMDDKKIAALKDILVRHGQSVLDEPLRFENLLKDTTLTSPERASLVAAAKLGIPRRILDQPESQITAGSFARYVDKLSSDMALRSEDARDAVATWARAFGRQVPDIPLTQQPLPMVPLIGPSTTTTATPLPPAKKWRWFAKIETKEQAQQTVRDASVFFFVISGLQIIMAFVVGPLALIDAAVYAAGGIVLRMLESRIAAVVLLIYSGLGVIVILVAGRPPILAAVAVWAGVRAVDATFKLHRKPNP